jgi:hypothetical protein
MTAQCIPWQPIFNKKHIKACKVLLRDGSDIQSVCVFQCFNPASQPPSCRPQSQLPTHVQSMPYIPAKNVKKYGGEKTMFNETCDCLIMQALTPKYSYTHLSEAPKCRAEGVCQPSSACKCYLRTSCQTTRAKHSCAVVQQPTG